MKLLMIQKRLLATRLQRIIPKISISEDVSEYSDYVDILRINSAGENLNSKAFVEEMNETKT